MPQLVSSLPLNQLKKLGIFSLSEAKEAGISQSSISRLSEAGDIIKLGSGFYMHPEAKWDPSTLDFSIACKKFGPEAFIGGLSALYFYKLIDEVPDRVWVIVPPERRTTERVYRLIRSKSKPSTDIEHKGHFKISSLERTLIESLKYGSKIGIQIAINATRRAIRDNRVTPESLFDCSKRLGLTSVIEKFWDLITIA
jgi:predicted transcriptional regulator of viral defense system